LRENIPYELKDVRKDIKNRAQKTVEDCKRDLREMERQLIEEWLPIEHQYTEQVDNALKKLISH
jgi:hypothetical protein